MRKQGLVGNRFQVLFLLSAVLMMLSGCATTTTYVRPDTVTKTPEFSDTDLRMNAEAMVNSLVAADFLQGLAAKPILVLGGIQNRTTDHIDTASIENTIERALLQSGLFRFVDRSILDQAAKEQALVSLQRIDVADAVKLGGVIGADYFLLGQMSSIDTTHGSRAVYYKKLTMKLVDVNTTEVVWLDEKEIKKLDR